MESTATRGARAGEGRDVAVGVVRGVLAVRPLIDALARPVNVVPMADGGPGAVATERLHNLERLEAFLNIVAARIGAPEFKVCVDGLSPRHSVFELAVSQRLIGEHSGLAGDAAFEAQVEDDVLEEALAGSFDRRYFRARLPSSDGTLLRAYTAGDRRNRAVVLVSPCGMPAKLCERWIELLSKDYFVVTWESRLLFEEPPDRDAFAFDVKAQTADLLAVMDHFEIGAAHLMGLCGGAVIAVSAAAARPGRVASLSLWHGDFELGPDCPKTKHQKDLKAFMLAAGTARRQAEQLHKLFSQNTLKNFREDLAHLVLYPYANAELLYRYAKSNGNIMDTNVRPFLANVAQRTVVVTSADDSTTHPEGSKQVAALLPNAVLQVVPHGDHLSLFYAASEVTDIATRFLASDAS